MKLFWKLRVVKSIGSLYSVWGGGGGVHNDILINIINMIDEVLCYEGSTWLCYRGPTCGATPLQISNMIYRCRVGENTPLLFSPNNHKIKSRYICIVIMDYVHKSDVEVLTTKLTLVMYRRENGFHSKWSNFQQLEKSVLTLVVL